MVGAVDSRTTTTCSRYYDLSLGRFTQLGPSGQEKSTYLYAGGGPRQRQ